MDINRTVDGVYPSQKAFVNSHTRNLDVDWEVGKVRTVTSNATLGPSDRTVYVDTSGGVVTVYLQPDPKQGQTCIVKKITSNANAMTVDGNGKTIEGLSSIGTGATVDLAALYLQYSGTRWESV